MRVRLPDKSKPNNYTESCMINEADGWRVCPFIKPFRIHCRRIPVTEKIYAYLYMAFFWVRCIP